MSAGGLVEPDITTNHVIVVLWFEMAVLCSKLLLYMVLDRLGMGWTGGEKEGLRETHPSLNTAFSFHF